MTHISHAPEKFSSIPFSRYPSLMPTEHSIPCTTAGVGSPALRIFAGSPPSRHTYRWPAIDQPQVSAQMHWATTTQEASRFAPAGTRRESHPAYTRGLPQARRDLPPHDAAGPSGSDTRRPRSWTI